MKRIAVAACVSALLLAFLTPVTCALATGFRDQDWGVARFPWWFGAAFLGAGAALIGLPIGVGIGIACPRWAADQWQHYGPRPAAVRGALISLPCCLLPLVFYWPAFVDDGWLKWLGILAGLGLVHGGATGWITAGLTRPKPGDTPCQEERL